MSDPQQVAVDADGRLLAWIPGRLRNPLNGSQGMTRNGRIARSKERANWRMRTTLCVKDAMNRAEWRHEPGDGKLIVLTAYVWNLYDPDALGGVLKPITDGLVDAGIIHSDGPKTWHRIERRQEINRKHRGVYVIVQARGNMP